jgi:hypothetical protein
MDLSRSTTPPEPAPEEPPPPPVRTDDWSLVRVPDGRVGWVLTRMLTMAIPDEVAQYAERHRITSYFSLGEVRDGDQVKHNWLWTTLGDTGTPYQFDSFRVFIWSLRRHRYETAYIERNLRGYYPVRVQPVEISEGGKPVSVPGFTLITEDKDGQTYQRTFAFVVNRVRQIGKTAYSRPSEPALLAQAAPAGEAEPADERDSGLRDTLSSWKRRLFGN